MEQVIINLEKVVPAIRMLLSNDSLKTIKVFETDKFIGNSLSILQGKTEEEIIANFKKYLAESKDNNREIAPILLVEGIGVLSIGNTAIEAEKNLENYQRNTINTSSQHSIIPVGRVANRSIIVTGAAQGFGEGIARCLFADGANVVVADLNEEIGQKTVRSINESSKSNKAIFVKTDVSKLSSIENLVRETICNFGAIDCFISNAGVLRAGGLEDMSLDDFEFVTKINYSAYFYCTKIVSKVMKLQTQYAPEYFADIIQINSKSGLRGSKANFAYAGGKFGGVGLTQSFALELAPFRIKVNSICPGNYYDGPLWSDPENGLFIQYLKAGKVPGAKTIEDVKEFYLAQVPMRKGCSPQDVTKAVFYLIDQHGETGQALPITGGQVMLN